MTKPDEVVGDPERGEDPAADDRRDAVIAKLSADLEALREHKDIEIDAVRGELEADHAEQRAGWRARERRYEQENQQLRDDVGDLRDEVSRLRAKLDEVYASETWRAGYALLYLPRKLLDIDQPPVGSRPRRR